MLTLPVPSSLHDHTAGNSGKAADSIGKAATKEEKKDEGRWDRLTDAYGRTYW